MIKINEASYKKFGKCIRFTNGTVELFVTIDIGPRIIFYGIDGINIMHEDINDNTNKGGEFFDKNLPGEGIWHIYGGHRLWKSPEYMDTYYPDNKAVDVEFIADNTVVFKSKIETTTKLQKLMKITMFDDGSVEIRHSIVNMGKTKTTPISAWALTVMDKGTIVTIPRDQTDTGFLPNNNIVFWSYDDVNDERLIISQKEIEVHQKDIVNPIKIGVFTKEKIKARVNNLDFTISVDVQDGSYPDYYSNVECYTNNYICEVETLSPLKELIPNEELLHVENWSIKRGE